MGRKPIYSSKEEKKLDLDTVWAKLGANFSSGNGYVGIIRSKSKR